MNWDGDLVAFAVDSNTIVVIVVLLVWCELNVNFFLRTGWNHSLFFVLDLEELCHWRQDMQPLRCWRQINEPDFYCVSLH